MAITRKCRNQWDHTTQREWTGPQKWTHILTSETLQASIIRRTMADVRSYTPTTIPTGQLTHSFREQTKHTGFHYLLIALRVLNLLPLVITSFINTFPGHYTWVLHFVIWCRSLYHRPIYTKAFLDTLVSLAPDIHLLYVKYKIWSFSSLRFNA